jgi:hypothetical protein
MDGKICRASLAFSGGSTPATPPPGGLGTEGPRLPGPPVIFSLIELKAVLLDRNVYPTFPFSTFST